MGPTTLPLPPFFLQNTSSKRLSSIFSCFFQFCTQYVVFRKFEVPRSCLLLFSNYPFLRCYAPLPATDGSPSSSLDSASGPYFRLLPADIRAPQLGMGVTPAMPLTVRRFITRNKGPFAELRVASLAASTISIFLCYDEAGAKVKRNRRRHLSANLFTNTRYGSESLMPVSPLGDFSQH